MARTYGNAASALAKAISARRETIPDTATTGVSSDATPKNGLAWKQPPDTTPTVGLARRIPTPADIKGFSFRMPKHSPKMPKQNDYNDNKTRRNPRMSMFRMNRPKKQVFV